MKFKIYYINLARSSDKKKFMESQLNRFKFSHSRIDAVDGQNLDMDRLNEFAVPSRVQEWKHLLKPNAIACSMSHHRAYEKMLDENVDIALILEDDIELGNDFESVLEKCLPKIKDNDIYLIYFHGDEKIFITKDTEYVDPKHSIYRAKTAWGAYSAGGYILSRKTAEKLRQHVFPVHTTADSWGTFKRDAVIGNLWAILPLVTKDAPFVSDIGYGSFSKLKRLITKNFIISKIYAFFKNHLKPVPHEYKITNDEPDLI